MRYIWNMYLNHLTEIIMALSQRKNLNRY